MISRSDDAASRRSNRIARIAIVGSVLVHLLAVLLVVGFSNDLDHLLAHKAIRQVKPADETVTLSTAIRFEKRPRAAAGHASRASAGLRPQRAQPVVRPQPRVAVVERSQPQRKAVARPPSRQRREIAKIVPRSTPEPRAVSAAATARPTPEARSQVALLEHPGAAKAQERPSHAQLNPAALARIQGDLAKSIAKDRARNNPLSNVTQRLNPAATMRRYTMNVAGRGATLRGAQGLCTPLRTWHASGYIYFNVTCLTQHPDGSFRDEVIPWPLRFRPDQVSYGPEGPAPPPGQIPLPPAGWKPAAAQYIDPDVIDFLRQYGYSVSASSR